MVNRRPAQTRARIAQTASRLHSLVHPAAVAPDELLVSERTGRISPRGGAGARLPAGGDRRGVRPAVGDLLVPARRDRARTRWAGRPVELVWDSGCEAMLYRDGAPVQGLVKGGGYDRTTAPLGTPTGRVELELEMACNDLMGLPDPFPRRRDRTGRTWQEPTDDRSLRAPRHPARLARAGLALLDPEAWELAWDFEALRQLVRGARPRPVVGGPAARRARPLRPHLVAADRATWPEARAILGDLLAHRNAGSAHEVTAIGHAHIDTAWLWPLAETRRKIVRSWASQLALMDRYPEHRFAASSAQHYAWLEQDAPELYERLRERVREGRWEVVGGSWVEPDLNLPSGESLVRQLLYGQRDLQERFGARCREFWTPDTFGYNGQVPQILRGAGIDRFLTQKLSWNQFNRAAAPLVRVGGDRRLRGARAHAAGRHLQRRADRSPSCARAPRAFKDHDRTAGSLLVFGHGDGGGGPTAEMLETGAPRGRPAGRPARAARADLGVLRPARGGPRRPRAPIGRRAVLRVPPRHLHEPGADQARQPRRRAAAARGRGRARRSRTGCRRRATPPRSCDALWQTRAARTSSTTSCPGSSIREVYEDAERDHARVAARATELRDAAIAALGRRPRR